MNGEEHSEGYINGWHAHKRGIDVDDNPYDPFTQAASHNRWINGWCARFSAVKHGQSLERDGTL